MKVFSDLSGQALAMYPSAISDEYVTRVIRFLNDQEQRFLVRDTLFRGMLQYAGVNGYDTSVLRRFLYSMRGAASTTDLSNTFSITIGNQTYPFCIFDQDDFTVEVDQAENNSFQLKIRQIAPASGGSSPSGDIAITSLTPSSVSVGSGDTTVVIAGYGFDPSAVAYFDGFTPLTTTFIDASTLSVVVTSDLLSTLITTTISVSQDTGSSNNATFAVSSSTASISLLNHDRNYITDSPLWYSFSLHSGSCLVLAIAARGENNLDFGASVAATGGVTFNLIASSYVQDCGGLPGATKYSQNFLFVATNCPATYTQITLSFTDSSAQGNLSTIGALSFFMEFSGIAVSSPLVVADQQFYPGLADSIVCGPMNDVASNSVAICLFMDWYFFGGTDLSFPDSVYSDLVQLSDGNYLGWLVYQTYTSANSSVIVTANPSFPPKNNMSVLGMILRSA